jgi:hypothetical protein
MGMRRLLEAVLRGDAGEDEDADGVAEGVTAV